jgi:hypothetical protein
VKHQENDNTSSPLARHSASRIVTRRTRSVGKLQKALPSRNNNLRRERTSICKQTELQRRYSVRVQSAGEQLLIHFEVSLSTARVCRHTDTKTHNWIKNLSVESYTVSTQKTLTRRPTCVQDTHALVFKVTHEYTCSQTLRGTCVYRTIAP